MDGAQALVAFLESRGVRVVFGLCGHTNVAVLAALEHSPVRFVGVHHEQMAAHAADGWTRASGELGVVLTHLGPGLTNALTGVANAALDGVPMLVISGNVQSYFIGRHAHMESTMHGDADQAESFAPFCKRIWRVERPQALLPAVDAAIRTALSGLPGPVLVDVAMDVFSATVEGPAPAASATAHAPGLDPRAVGQVVEMLAGAERPVVYAGSGVAQAQAGEALARLAEAFGAPIAYSLMGKGAVPDDHPLVVGMTGLWGTPAANAACARADVLLAIGTRFGELDTSSWQPGTSFAIPPTRLIHIHVDPSEIGRSYPVEIGAVADAGIAVAELAEAVDGRATGAVTLADELAKLREEFAAQVGEARESDVFPLHPARVVAAARAAIGNDGVLVGDTGWNKNGVAQQVAISRPGQFVAPGGYATMGFGPAAALGAALANPEGRTLALVGDGAFLANLSVVVTAVEERIPVVWAVMNNGTYATISGMQRRHFGSDYGASFDSTTLDYTAFAKSVGAQGARVGSPTELPELLDRALAAGTPFVVDVPCGEQHVPTTGHWDINDLFSHAP